MCAKTAGSVLPAPPPKPPDEFYAAFDLGSRSQPNLFLAEQPGSSAAPYNANVEPAKPTSTPSSTPSWPPAPELILDE